MENLLLCSFAHHACSPLQGFLHEEELCEVTLPCQFFVRRVVLQSGVELVFEFSDMWSFWSLVFFTWSPIPEGLQQYGEGCDGRKAMACKRLLRSAKAVQKHGLGVLFFFVGVRTLCLLAEGGVYPSRYLWVSHSESDWHW